MAPAVGGVPDAIAPINRHRAYSNEEVPYMQSMGYLSQGPGYPPQPPRTAYLPPQGNGAYNQGGIYGQMAPNSVAPGPGVPPVYGAGYPGAPPYYSPSSYEGVQGNAINTSQIVQPLVMDPGQRYGQSGFSYPSGGSAGYSDQSSAPKATRRPVLKDKDGKSIDISSLKGSSTQSTGAKQTPEQAKVPRSQTASTTVAANPVKTAPEPSRVTEGDGDIVIEVPDDDVEVPTCAAEAKIVVVKHEGKVSKSAEISESVVSKKERELGNADPNPVEPAEGNDAAPSCQAAESGDNDDFVIELPDTSTPSEEKVEKSKTRLDNDKSEVGVQAPVESDVPSGQHESGTASAVHGKETLSDIVDLPASSCGSTSILKDDVSGKPIKPSKDNQVSDTRNGNLKSTSSKENSNFRTSFSTESVHPTSTVPEATSTDKNVSISVVDASKVGVLCEAEKISESKHGELKASTTQPEKNTPAMHAPPVLLPSSAPAEPSSSTRRSLRPGGGKAREVLNVPGAQANRPRLVYSKTQLRALIPSPLNPRPPALNAYDMITIIEGGSSRQVKSVCMGGTPVYVEKPPQSSKTSSGGHAVEKWAKQPPPTASNDDRSSQYRHGRGRRNVPIPMPKKHYDQLEKYGRDVQAILNKLSPGNYRKLLEDMCNIECLNIEMMEKLITLIFEKALQEPGFSKMYAEMCAYIEQRSPHILCNFFYVVHCESTAQYRWVKDLQLPIEFAGPFDTEVECLNAMSSTVTPQVQQIHVGRVVHVSLVMRGEYLIQIAKSIDKDAFYVNRIAVETVDSEKFSERLFGTPEAATKDYTKKHGFRRHLVTTCQNEFLASVDLQMVS